MSQRLARGVRAGRYSRAFRTAGRAASFEGDAVTRSRVPFVAAGLFASVVFLVLPLRCVSLDAAAAQAAAQPPAVKAPAEPRATDVAAQPARPETKGVKGYTLSAERYRQAVAFNRVRNRLHFLGFAYGILVYLLVLPSLAQDVSEAPARNVPGELHATDRISSRTR